MRSRLGTPVNGNDKSSQGVSDVEKQLAYGLPNYGLVAWQQLKPALTALTCGGWPPQRRYN
jgi:hypothetical protein